MEEYQFLSDRPALRLGETTGKAKSDREHRLSWKERDPEGYRESQKRRNQNRKKSKQQEHPEN